MHGSQGFRSARVTGKDGWASGSNQGTHRWRILGACLWFLCWVAAAQAQAPPPAFTDVRQLPDGPQGERIQELLRVLETPDRAKIEAFVKTHFAPGFLDAIPLPEHVDVLTSTARDSRGYDFYGIRKYEGGGGPTGTVAIVSNRLTGAWEAFVLQFEPQPPHRIAGLELLRARPPRDLPARPPLSEAEAMRELGAFVDRLAQADVFSGTVLVAREGQVLYEAARGESDKSCGRANQMDTKFNLGSMNKMFTAVAIAQLVEQEKLGFQDAIGRYLDAGWLPKVDLGKVRIEHLLTHTSGLGSYFNDEYWRSSRTLYRDIDDYKPLIARDSLAFEPGTRWQYSNTGFLLLGAIIEKVSGQSYFDYVREHIFVPAGMTNTDSYEMDAVVPDLAQGYHRVSGPGGETWRTNLFEHVIKGGPAGGGFSTAPDLLRFDAALRAHRIVGPEATLVLWSPKRDLNSPTYGYGFGLSGEPGDRRAGHTGGFVGISAQFFMHLDRGYTVVVLSNYDGGAGPVQQKIDELLGRVQR